MISIWAGPALPGFVLGGALWVALAVDHCLGEPTVRWHPVVWMGNYLGYAGEWVQARTRQVSTATPDLMAFWLGAIAWSAGAALVLIAACVLQWLAMRLLEGGPWGPVLAAALLGWLLKPMMSWALLRSEVQAVEQALNPEMGGSLQAGRARLRWLVSRDVATLSATEVRESAIETLAENLNDSVVAPLFWFVVLGLPGAALFRFANTADAMWGYPGPYQGRNWQWAGKWAARADDVLGWLPARLTALMLVLVARRVPWRSLRVEAARTVSPNSGWPMASMALALGVCLRKPGVYALNAAGRAPMEQDTAVALAYASKTLLALVGCAQAALVLIAFWNQW